MTYTTLEQRVELERGKRNPSEVVELILDNAKSSKIEGITDEYTSLEALSMVNVGLQSLVGMPSLPSLKSLELSYNLITDELDALLACPGIDQLNLSNNKIEKVEALLPFAKLCDLQSLDLTNCPVAAEENYRKKIFAMIPSLKFLDGLDENNEKEPIADEGVNGDADELDGADDDASECDYEVEDGDDEDIGISALQQSGELEDDEEDYVPEDDDDEEEEEDADEDELDDFNDVDYEDGEEGGANVDGTERAYVKRKYNEAVENGDGDGPSPAKHKYTDSGSAEAHMNNGSSVNE